MRVRPVLVLTTSAVTALATIGLATTTADAQPSASQHRASVTHAARDGGRVIVTLRQQFADLKVKKDGARRTQATRASQRGLLAELHAHGAHGIRQLVSVNAVAATVSKAEVTRLRANPDVAAIQRDVTLQAPAATFHPAAGISKKICPTDPSQPLLEPEALSLTHFKSEPARPDDADTVATGEGVRIGLTGINRLAGNPNFIRPNGEHVVVDSPTPNADDSDFGGGGDEWYGDASTISGQGTVTYDFSKELPYSGLPAGCTFQIVGIAPGASLVDTGYFGQGVTGDTDTTPATESEQIAGLDHAAIDEKVSVVSESYGYGAIPGQTDFSAITVANDALVAAGITVVESAGDSGVGGTVEVPAYDPLVIDAAATTSLRLNAQAWGYTSWENNQITALSSGGTTPDNNVVDLAAPGFGGEATCSPASATCPQDTLTEAFGGTSQSAPYIAGAAADVIQAYADSHGGAQPTPALVKQILTGTAADIGAPSEEQGAGLLDVYAAVRAAQQQPGSTEAGSDDVALLPTPTQLNVTGQGGSSATRSVSLYNASSHSQTVRGWLRDYTADQQIGQTVTEQVSAPKKSQPLPAEGAQAAAPVSMTVPKGLSQLGVDFITPNPKNNAILSLLLFDPKGRLSQISYDYSSTTGKVSNNQHVSINHPMPGTWTSKIVWNNGRSHLQDPPPKPGDYRGPISIRYTGRHAHQSAVTDSITIPARQSASVPITVTLPKTPGDAPLGLKFVSDDGSVTAQVPVTRRTLIPSTGGPFTTTLGSSVARDFGPLKSFQIDVPAGQKDLRVKFHTADTSADNVIDYFAVEPNGIDGFYDRTPSTTPQGINADGQRGDAALVVANPPAGRWTIQVMLDITTSGKEFTQDVTGDVAYDTAQVHAYNVPNDPGQTYDRKSRTTVQVAVTNTTGVGRPFRLAGTAGDVQANAVYIPAGATALVTGTLRPTAAPGTVVSGQLVVVSLGSALSPLLKADGYLFDVQTLAELPYQYTVTRPASA